jgi:hypothetical protein
MDREFAEALNLARESGAFCPPVPEELKQERVRKHNRIKTLLKLLDTSSTTKEATAAFCASADLVISDDAADTAKRRAETREQLVAEAVKELDELRDSLSSSALEKEYAQKPGFFEDQFGKFCFHLSPQDLINGFFDGTICTHGNAERTVFNDVLIEIFARETGAPMM